MWHRLTCLLPERLYSSSACNERVVSLLRAWAVNAAAAASCSRKMSGICSRCFAVIPEGSSRHFLHVLSLMPQASEVLRTTAALMKAQSTGMSPLMTCFCSSLHTA